MEVVPLAKLGPPQWQQWRSLCATDASLENPYFDPGFALAVEAARGGVFVLVMPGEHGPSFLPFECQGAVGYPAGFPANDYHGPVAAPGARIDGQSVLRATGLKRFVYNHLLETPAVSDWPVELRARSPYMRLGGGLQGYAAQREDNKLPDHIKATQRVGRKVPGLRFEFDCRDARMLALLVEWKRRQYAATNAPDFFDEAGLRLVQECFGRREPTFSGVLSVAYSGDQPMALHLGLRSGGLLHSWFPAYDPAFGKFSPGILLMIYLIEEADALGLTKVDFGRGEMDYKRRLMTGANTVCEGELDRSAWRGSLRRRCRQSWRELKSTGLYDRLRKVKAKVQSGS